MCVLQVTLAYESIVLYMCEGKVLMDTQSLSAEGLLPCKGRPHVKGEPKNFLSNHGFFHILHVMGEG